MTFPPEWGPLELAEAKIIIATVEHYYNLTQSAKALKISYRCLAYKVKLYVNLGLLPAQYCQKQRHTLGTLDLT